MEPAIQESTKKTVKPECSIFGECGGCAYQDIPYEEELRIKKAQLRELFDSEFDLADDVFEPIVASPEPYYYRHRLDLAVRKTKAGDFFMGYNPLGSRFVISVDSCAIARREVSDFIPELQKLVRAKIPDKYRTANIVVRTGDDGRVFWGGIGRHSLCMPEEDYLWTVVNGRKIFYSLETFFQANLSILDALVSKVKELGQFDQDTLFLDLYSGVGLFGLSLVNDVRKVVMLEEHPGSIRLANYNVKYHGLENQIEIIEGRVENELESVLSRTEPLKPIAMIDPPRKGLAPTALESLMKWGGSEKRGTLFYLSCYLPSLIRDLKGLTEAGWKIKKVIPFDLFPKTKHLETLVLIE